MAKKDDLSVREIVHLPYASLGTLSQHSRTIWKFLIRGYRISDCGTYRKHLTVMVRHIRIAADMKLPPYGIQPLHESGFNFLASRIPVMCLQPFRGSILSNRSQRDLNLASVILKGIFVVERAQASRNMVTAGGFAKDCLRIGINLHDDIFTEV